MRKPQFSTYILCNLQKTVLFVGATDDLPAALVEHWAGVEGSFTNRFNVHYLVWYETAENAAAALFRKDGIDGLTKSQQVDLVSFQNPGWTFRNAEILGDWAPGPEHIAAVRLRWNGTKDEELPQLCILDKACEASRGGEARRPEPPVPRVRRMEARALAGSGLRSPPIP